jgi:hypothetical protein
MTAERHIGKIKMSDTISDTMVWGLFFGFIAVFIVFVIAMWRYPRLKKFVENALAWVVGAAMIVGLVALGIWLIWGLATGSLLADQFNYITDGYALAHLRDSNCSLERDILEVDEVKDASVEDKGRKVEMRQIIYSFRKRPVNGPVSAEVMRSTATLFKDENGKWTASCDR